MARPSVCVDSPSGLIRRQALLQPPHPRVQLAGPRCPVMFAHIVYGGARRGPILPLDTRRNLVFTRAHFALAEFPNRAPVREAGAKSLSNYLLPAFFRIVRLRPRGIVEARCERDKA